MAFDVDDLLRLWTSPLPPAGEAEAAFREYYTDPVRVNGALHALDAVALTRPA
ncbi:hypothetical protein ACIBI9_14135 [Nonomuraea sp. NPDC050451]|uniref:hypothetical protein n=1 Tax=Nonomuraea sp. NPDC050451 TaxID=3364364 RepID=UPI00378A3759